MVLGILSAVGLLIVLLLLTLGLNELDAQRIESDHQKGISGSASEMPAAFMGFMLMWSVPLVPLHFISGLPVMNLLNVWGCLAWTTVLIVLFFATRRFVYRPLMRRLDARRSQQQR